MSIFLATRSGIGKAVRITGNTRISFKGSGRARFRLQHTGSEQDRPFALGWTDITILSDLRLDDPRSVIDADMTIAGFLVDWISGDTVVEYRRFSADYLRVVVFDEDDVDNETACMNYVVTFEPILEAA